MVLGTMVCSSFVLGGDANTGSAGYVCLETELVDGESDLLAATPVATASFAAFVTLPSFIVVCLVAAAMPAALMMMVAALSGVLRLHAAMLIFAALSVGSFSLAAMLIFAALSDGYGGYACCEVLFGVFARGCEAE